MEMDIDTKINKDINYTFFTVSFIPIRMPSLRL